MVTETHPRSGNLERVIFMNIGLDRANDPVPVFDFPALSFHLNKVDVNRYEFDIASYSADLKRRQEFSAVVDINQIKNLRRICDIIIGEQPEPA